MGWIDRPPPPRSSPAILKWYYLFQPMIVILGGLAVIAVVVAELARHPTAPRTVSSRLIFAPSILIPAAWRTWAALIYYALITSGCMLLTFWMRHIGVQREAVRARILRLSRAMTFCVYLFVAGGLADIYLNHVWDLIPTLSLVTVITVCLRRAFGKPSKAIRLARYAHSGGECPECAYDLTGNQSGICPECGNSVPARGAAEFPWNTWWERWDIASLTDPKPGLADAFMVILLAGIPTCRRLDRPPVAAIGLCVMAALGLHAWRIFQYGRRRNTDNSVESQAQQSDHEHAIMERRP